MKIAEFLLRTLEANGVRRIFGNPGTTEIPLVRACERRRGIRYIVALSEVAAVPMADGCAVHLHPGTEPNAVMQRITATIPVARVGLSRLRLEDVFLRVVAADAGDSEAEQALRADLQGLGTEGALA